MLNTGLGVAQLVIIAFIVLGNLAGVAAFFEFACFWFASVDFASLRSGRTGGRVGTGGGIRTGEGTRTGAGTMTAVDTWHVATVLVGGIGTLAIFSFLIRENPFFRLFEHLFIGIAAGFGLVLGVKNFLWPEGAGADARPGHRHLSRRQPLPRVRPAPPALPAAHGLRPPLLFHLLATVRVAGQAGHRLLPGHERRARLQGVLQPDSCPRWSAVSGRWWCSRTGSWRWAAAWRMPSSSSPCWRSCTTSSSPSGTRPGRLAASPLSGRWLLMVCFGAFFGSTVMARTALLVERVQFLLIDWAGALAGLVA